MKRTTLLFTIILLCSVLIFAGCGNNKAETDATEETEYYPSSLSVRSFTAVAGENIDETKSTENGTVYIYEIKDTAVGAAAYDLYKDYLAQNFTYSMIDSSVSQNGYTSVYTDEAGGKQIIYTETVDEDGIYTVTVTVPE